MEEQGKVLKDLRDHLVKKWSEIESGFPKTNTKKFKYWQGYADAITAIDNYILIKTP